MVQCCYSIQERLHQISIVVVLIIIVCLLNIYETNVNETKNVIEAILFMSCYLRDSSLYYE